MREYYEKRARGVRRLVARDGPVRAARRARAGTRTWRRCARCCTRWRRRGRSISRAARGSSHAGCRGSWWASTRARRCSRSRARAARTPRSCRVTRWSRDPASSGSSAAHFYGHLDAEQRERFLALPCDELVIVDSALRPGGVAEDWQERVLDDGSRHSRLQALVHGRGAGRRSSAAARSCTTGRGSWPSEVRAGAPERRALAALAEREVGRQRRDVVPGGVDALGHRRAVLEAVARAAADDPVGRVLGVRGDDEVRVGRDLVAAALRALQRRLRQRGEAVGDVAARQLLGRGRRGRQVGVGVQRRALPRPRRPSRRARRGRRCRRSRGRSRPSPATSRQPSPPSKKNSSCWVTRSLTCSGKSPASQPPQLHTTRSPSTTVPSSRRTRAALRAGTASDDPRAASLGLSRQRLHRLLRAQHAGLGLVQHPRQVVAAEGGETPRRLLDRPALGGDVQRLQGALGLGLPAVVAVREPAHAGVDQQVRAGLALELLPERARAPRHRGVVGVRAVRAADQPRLAAARRAHVAGLELIDEHDLVALPGQPPRQRRAERPTANDHDPLHGADATTRSCSLPPPSPRS